MDEVRMVLFLAMFAVLAWHDFRTRKLDDKIFLVFGGAGAVLYLFDWQSTNSYETLVVLCSASGATVLWRFKIVGTADMFAIIAGGVIYPVHLGIIPTMLLIFVITIVLAAISTVFGNVVLNTLDATRRGGLFCDVSDKKWRKCLAFFMVHRQRKFDKHSFLAENVVDGKRRLSMGRKPGNRGFAAHSETQYVEYAMPFLTIAAVPAFILVILGWIAPVELVPLI